MTSYETYEHLLNDTGDGTIVDPTRPQVARELARIGLSLAYYTQWYWKVDLHNLLHFLSLRLHPHAQYELRVYGEVIADMVKAWVPHAWSAFKDYRLESAAFSGPEIEILRAALRGQDIHALIASSELSRREEAEFRKKIKIRRPTS